MDVDRDCQNARHEVLIAESTTSVGFNTEKGCRVVSGSWNDPTVAEPSRMPANSTSITWSHSRMPMNLEAMPGMPTESETTPMI